MSSPPPSPLPLPPIVEAPPLTIDIPTSPPPSTTPAFGTAYPNVNISPPEQVRLELLMKENAIGGVVHQNRKVVILDEENVQAGIKHVASKRSEAMKKKTDLELL